MSTEKVRCPAGHTRTWKHGVIPTIKGQRVRYRCYICGKTFYLDSKPLRPYPKPKAPPKKKTPKKGVK